MPLHGRHREAVQATRATGRGAVAVQANLFGRLTRVVRSYTFFYGDSAGALRAGPGVVSSVNTVFAVSCASKVREPHCQALCCSAFTVSLHHLDSRFDGVCSFKSGSKPD